MAEHTKLPWQVTRDERGSIIRTIDGMECPVASMWLNGDDPEANAALIVKAVNAHEALLEFFRWAMREGPWDGGDLDGGSIQDKAEALGLIVKTQYDAEKHGVQCDFETGDDWFEYAPHIKAVVSSPATTERTDG